MRWKKAENFRLHLILKANWTRATPNPGGGVDHQQYDHREGRSVYAGRDEDVGARWVGRGSADTGFANFRKNERYFHGIFLRLIRNDGHSSAIGIMNTYHSKLHGCYHFLHSYTRKRGLPVGGCMNTGLTGRPAN